MAGRGAGTTARSGRGPWALRWRSHPSRVPAPGPGGAPVREWRLAARRAGRPRGPRPNPLPSSPPPLGPPPRVRISPALAGRRRVRVAFDRLFRPGILTLRRTALLGTQNFPFSWNLSPRTSQRKSSRAFPVPGILNKLPFEFLLTSILPEGSETPFRLLRSRIRVS